MKRSARRPGRWLAWLVVAVSAALATGCSLGGSDPGHFEGSGTACGTHRVAGHFLVAAALAVVP